MGWGCLKFTFLVLVVCVGGGWESIEHRYGYPQRPKEGIGSPGTKFLMHHPEK